MFLPRTRIIRDEALSMIQSGIVLFIETRKIKPVALRVVNVENVKYLRVDGESIPRDELWDLLKLHKVSSLTSNTSSKRLDRYGFHLCLPVIDPDKHRQA